MRSVITMFNEEIWKPIKHPYMRDQYEISSFGRVRNINTNHILGTFTSNSGYLRIAVNDPRYSYKKNINLSVHRLVAETFIPNPENKPIVNHINGNKLDNRVINLEWVTYSENRNHAYINNLDPQGENKPNSKLKNKDVHKISKMLSDGYRLRDVCSYMIYDGIGIKREELYSIIYDIVRGHSWQFIYNQYPKFTGDRKEVLFSKIRMLYKSGYKSKEIRHILKEDFNYVDITANYIKETITKINKYKGSTTIENKDNVYYIHI